MKSRQTYTHSYLNKGSNTAASYRSADKSIQCCPDEGQTDIHTVTSTKEATQQRPTGQQTRASSVALMKSRQTYTHSYLNKGSNTAASYRSADKSIQCCPDEVQTDIHTQLPQQRKQHSSVLQVSRQEHPVLP